MKIKKKLKGEEKECHVSDMFNKTKIIYYYYYFFKTNTKEKRRIKIRVIKHQQ
jgi:hypothetical protein